MRWILWMGCAALAFGQVGTQPKPKAEEYELHARAGRVELGAEFMVHSFSGPGQTFIVKDYLVVEVALYPEKGLSVHADHSDFALRVNGKPRVIPSMPPTAVVAAIENPQMYGGGPRLDGGAGVGGVILGIPGTGGRQGGPDGRPVPAPPRAPDPNAPPGVDPPEQVSPNELLVRTALPAGDFKGPVSGFLYFPYRGKTSSIKSLELLYGDTVLKVR
jgi:hypothetical protein